MDTIVCGIGECGMSERRELYREIGKCKIEKVTEMNYGISSIFFLVHTPTGEKSFKRASEAVAYVKRWFPE